MNTNRIVVSTLLVAAVAFVAGVLYFNAQGRQERVQAVQDNTQALIRPHSPVYGNPKAKVKIVEFFDPSCEACRAFYPIVTGIVNSSFGQVNLVIRYAPLHRGSDVAVKILEAARKQDLYWPIVEKVLETQPTWADHGAPRPEMIWELVKESGLDIAKAQAEADGADIAKILQQDVADMVTLNVQRTPSFFVNGKPLLKFGAEELRGSVASEMRNSASTSTP